MYLDDNLEKLIEEINGMYVARVTIIWHHDGEIEIRDLPDNPEFVSLFQDNFNELIGRYLAEKSLGSFIESQIEEKQHAS